MKKLLSIFILIILILGIWVWSGVYLPKEPNSAETVVFSVKKGEGAKEISINLKEQNLIRYKSLFRVYVLIKGFSGGLKAGEYSFSYSMNIPQIVEKLVSGKVIEKKITIIEGWNLKDIGRYFENEGLFSSEDFFYKVTPTEEYIFADFVEEFDFLKDKPAGATLEGYLFPDTYEIFSGDGIENIVRETLANFGKKLNQDLKEEITLQRKTIFEIVTMASLIEKEVKTKEDKEIVSGILWKRLENDIPLQVDATINYITGKNTTKIFTEETKIDSPYNTYKYKGLPFGPICNPGLESISAAIYPKDSQYWYYLSAPDGKTIFSKTLKEHNIAKEKYLK